MWRRVCLADQLPQGASTAFRSDDANIAIFNTPSGLYAIHNVCPHVHTELHNGDVDHGVVYCPRHSWGFQLKDGACVVHARYNLATFPVKEEAGYIMVDPDGAQHAAG